MTITMTTATNKRLRKWAVAITFLSTLLVLGAGLPEAKAFTSQTLVIGSRGYDVDELQGRLKLLGFYKNKVDGYFGWDTYWAVRIFQQQFIGKPTGVVDLQTRQALVKATPNWHSPSYSTGNSGTSNSNSGSASNSPSTASSSPPTAAPNSPPSSAANVTLPATAGGFSQSDLSLMAHVVYAEARGEPFIGQVAVAAVLINRMHSPKFPHSIPAIVYQPLAFTSVADGQINLQPNAEAMRAVMDAVHGWDPSHGALYYFNPATATSAWIWSKPEILQIGHHIFCK